MPSQTKITRAIIITVQILLLSLASFVLLRHSPHVKAAGTITVNSKADIAADDGECTLREAITSANTDTASGATPGECVAGSGSDTINFAITGTASFTNGGQDGYSIHLLTALPDIDSQITINGYSQAGSQANTAIAPAPFNGILLIELSGEDLPSVIAGQLNLIGNADNSVIRGLVINQSTGAGIFLNPGADNVVIQGNYIGTDSTGLLDKGNYRSGITTDGDQHWGNGPKNALVGGTDPEDRNIISANSTHSNDPDLLIGSQGIAIIHGSDNWVVQGNYIGVGSNGTTDLGNELGGMTIDYASNLVIGGDVAGSGNLISGNGDGGLQPDGVHGMSIQRNYIGTDYTGANPLPNGTKGISVAYGSTNVLIGGQSQADGNIIAFNLGVGISVWQEATQNVTNIGNSIHDNGSIGLDLLNMNTGGGVTPNDSLDSDTGSNGLLNYPGRLIYSVNGANTDLNYNLDVPAGTYRVEFYANTTSDASGHGEGETYIGSQTITSTGTGSQSFNTTVSGNTHTYIAATATQVDESADGFGATSEYSYLATPNVDIALGKTLLNPQDVTPGSTINYLISMSNNGTASLDLTQYTQVLSGQPLFVDYAPPELSSSDHLADGPFPGSFIVDAGNPDLTCIDAGPGSAGTFFGMTTHGDYTAIICWYTGALTDLSPGDKIDATIGFTVGDNSDLHFTNYVVAPSITDDPDYPIVHGFGQDGNDLLDDLIANSQSNSPVNNFAVAAYAPSEVSTIDVPAILPKVGIAGGILTLVIATAAALIFGLRPRRLKSLP